MSTTAKNPIAHFREFPQLPLEGSPARGRQILLRELIELGTRRFREGRGHLVSVDIAPYGMVEVAFHGDPFPASELEKLRRYGGSGPTAAQLSLLKVVAFSRAVRLSFPDERRERKITLFFVDGEYVSRETAATEDADAVLTVNFLPDSKIMGDTDYDLEATGAYLEQTAFLNAGLSIWFKGRGLYFKTDGTAGLFRKFFPETDPATVFSWCGPVFEFTVGRARRGSSGMIRSFAGDRETVDGGAHVNGFRIGMTESFRYCTGRFVPPERLFRDWNAVIAVHFSDPTFESGYICRLGGDVKTEALFCLTTNKVMTELLTRDPDYLERCLRKKKTPRKKETPAERSARRSVDEWFERVMASPELLEDAKCPRKKFSLQQWKALILRHPSALQFDPPPGLKTVLAKDDFRDWTGHDVCTALFMDGEWLSNLLPLEKITQEDFDDFFGAEAFPDAKEFWEVVPGYFPLGIPPHLETPYPKPKNRGGS